MGSVKGGGRSGHGMSAFVCGLDVRARGNQVEKGETEKNK